MIDDSKTRLPGLRFIQLDQTESTLVIFMCLRLVPCFLAALLGAYLMAQQVVPQWVEARWLIIFEAAVYAATAAIGGLWAWSKFSELQYLRAMGIDTSPLEAPKPKPLSIEQAAAAQTERLSRRTGFTGIEIGTSTGFLLGRGHHAGMTSGKKLVLSMRDACQNILVCGGIGAGKTSLILNPIVTELFSQDCGALIFNVKGDYSQDVYKIAQQTGREIVEVGYQARTLNLLQNATPELACDYIRSLINMNSDGTSSSSAFFQNNAIFLCEACLNLIRLQPQGDYSLSGLATLLADQTKRQAIIDEIQENLTNFADLDQELFLFALQYLQVYNALGTDQRGDVLSTAMQVLTPFLNPKLRAAFSSNSPHGTADLLDLVEKGSIFLINLPTTIFGNDGARYGYTMIKLNFFSMMRRRRTEKQWNQVRPVAFVADEYHKIIDKISDSDAWDKLRASGCIGVVAAQGLSSLQTALGSKDDLDSVTQNFRQKFVMRNEDPLTIDFVQKLLGKIDVLHVHHSTSNSTRPSGHPTGLQIDVKSSSDSTSHSITAEDLFGPDLMRKLGDDEALFIGSSANESCDEVLKV